MLHPLHPYYCFCKIMVLLQIIASQSYSIEVDEHSSLGNIFDLLSDQGILPKNAKSLHAFYYHGTRLNMNMTCADYGIIHDSAVHIAPLPSSCDIDFKDYSTSAFHLHFSPLTPNHASTEAVSNFKQSSTIPSISKSNLTNPPLDSEKSSDKALLTRPATSRRRCCHPTCTRITLRLAGNCLHCNGRFCAAHRLMEDHDCVALFSLRKEEHERNRIKLEKEHGDTLISKV